MEVAIADEIAAKESMQVQQRLSQPVLVDNMDSPVSTGQNQSTLQALPPPNCQTSTSKSLLRSIPYTCFLCGNSGHTRPKCKFRNAAIVETAI